MAGNSVFPKILIKCFISQTSVVPDKIPIFLGMTHRITHRNYSICCIFYIFILYKIKYGSVYGINLLSGVKLNFELNVKCFLMKISEGIRPGCASFAEYPNDPKINQSIVEIVEVKAIPHGYKMKCDQIANGSGKSVVANSSILTNECLM